MKALSFWKSVTMDKADFLEDLLALLRDRGIHFCVIGGQGVNAYVEPLVSLDLDLAVAVDQIDQVRKLMQDRFHAEEFEHSLNISTAGSDLRVQIQTDPRYGAFVEHSAVREVLGLQLPVASLKDVLQGKIWAASDPQRPGTKRRKDCSISSEFWNRIPISGRASRTRFFASSPNRYCALHTKFVASSVLPLPLYTAT